MPDNNERVAAEIERIKKGGAEKYHVRNREQKRLFARDRLKLLLDDGKIEFEENMFAECLNPELPADGCITGIGRIHGRPVAFNKISPTTPPRAPAFPILPIPPSPAKSPGSR